MKHILKISLLTASLSTLIFFQAFSQSWQFAESFGGQSGSSSSNNNQPNNLVVDDYGNSYVYGTYGNLTEFEDSTIQYFTDQTRGAFIAKFNCNGEAEWFKSVAHTEQFNNSADYMLLKDDYLYISGVVKIDNFYKTWFLDTLVIGSILYQDYPNDCTYPWIPFNTYTYMIKMDLDGNIVDYNLLSLKVEDMAKINGYRGLWLNPKYQRPFSIDRDGNYYMFARLNNDQKAILYCNNVQISDTIVPHAVTGESNVSSSYYKLKFDSDFNLLWFEPIIMGVGYFDIYAINFDILDMTHDTENNMYFVGYVQTYDDELDNTQVPIILDLGNNQTLETYGHQSSSGYLIKMNSDGDVLWTQQTKQFYEEPFYSTARFESLKLDESSNSIYVGGYAQPVTSYISGTGTIFGENDTVINTIEGSSANSGFIAKYDLNGNYQWVVNPVTKGCLTSSIDLYNNKLYSLVRWNNEFQHGDDVYTYPIGTGGYAVCTWDINGNPLETIPIESTCSGQYNIFGFDTRVNNMGEIVVTGTYDYGLTFGDHSIYGEGFKMFIAKYGNACPIITDETETFCYGEEYNGTILTESGDYNFILESSQPEVDSIVNLHATVYPQLTTGISDTTFCTNETYILEANLGYNSYDWSTGSTSSQQELTYTTIGTENVYVTLTDDNCIGVDTIVITIEVCSFIEQQGANSLNIYPVPTNSHVTIQLSDTQKIEAYSVFNLQGKLIKSENIRSESSFTITTQELQAGQYLIYVKTVEGVYTGGFVKE